MSQEKPEDLPGAIAVVGLAGRFPQASSLDQFWQNLIDGREVSTTFTEEELLAEGIDPDVVRNPDYVPVRAILDGAEQFDAAFFGYSPREAQVIDPQQRLFLECAWEALENAGYDPDRYPGSIGVFAGQSMNTYLMHNILANPDVLASNGAYQVMLGNDKDFLTTRVSYKLNLKGPSVNVQTACSTSLVAVHMACQSLLSYQSDLALAGGVSIGSPRKAGYLYQPGMIMSPDGRCRAFDHRAQGIFSGEGVGIVVLKRYSEAVRDGDTIQAIIRGSAINNDGSLKVGYTAPSVDGQAEAILIAQAVAGVEPGSITYIEAHGTGTELGDPIEISALTQAFRAGTQERGFCAIASLKTHMGHLDAAAGVASLIKTVLALKHRRLPPNLNFEKPNPQIDFESTPFYVNAGLREWNTDRLPRRAGVSAFGIGGTNAHVVLEEAGPAPAGRALRPDQLLLFSARSEAALDAAAKSFASWLRQDETQSLADAAYTLQVGRKVFKHRRMAVCRTAGEAVSVLEAADGEGVSCALQDARDIPVVFLFPGQGAQYANMGCGLYKSEAVFRQEVDRCAEILKPHLGLDLRDVLYPAPDKTEQAEDLLRQTRITQPALFTVEYALAKLWMSWGIRPQAMAGHSIGEFVAACLAGVFSLEDGLALVAARGKLIQALPGGSMLSIPLPEAEVLPLLDSELSLAAINNPEMCVISGPHAAIDRLQAGLSERGVECRRLHTSHAFHSAMLEPVLGPFSELVEKTPRQDPQIPYLSNLTGGWIRAEQATSPDYWAAHLRSTVRFSQNLEALFQEPAILLEVGPGQTLSALARRHAGKPSTQAVLTSMRHPQEQAADLAVLTRTFGRLWLSGASPDWEAYHAGEKLHRIPLPTYPFERKRCWLDPQKPAGPASGNHPAAPSKRQDMSSWFYLPSWQRSAWLGSAPGQKGKQNYLLFCDVLGVGQALKMRLEGEGHTVVTVQVGDAFAQTGERAFTLQPEAEGQYARLLNALPAGMEGPTRIVHLWTLTSEPERSLVGLQEMQLKGFYSLLALAQALDDRRSGQPVEMLVVSNHLHEVTGGERLCPAKASLLGPCRVIPQEYPGVTCRSVDIVLPDLPLKPGMSLAAQILAEFSLRKPEPVVAYRGTHRWTQTYIPNPLPQAAPDPLKLRRQGVYLITGGYGGIGLTLAGYLAQAVQAKLVLMGRSGLPDRPQWQVWLESHPASDRTSQKIRAVQDLENRGASVLLLRADVSDEAQMRSALAQVRGRFGSLNGVIHAAGVPGGGLIQLKSKDQAAKVLSPKIQGTWILDQLLEAEAEPLDFFLLCSSISSVIGGAGQVDYCAANAFLDAFAQMKNAGAGAVKVLSVDWAAWQEVGMAVETEVPANLQRWKEENLRSGIHPTQGVDAFQRILANPAPQAIVSPLDIQALLAFGLDQGPQQKGGLQGSSSGPGVSNQLPGRENGAALQETQPAGISTGHVIEKKMTEIWQDLIGVEPIGLHDNFFELGGHSLMAIQVLARIRDLYKIELPLRTFFETSTIAELSKRIDAMLWIERSQEAASPVSADREEISL